MKKLSEDKEFTRKLREVAKLSYQQTTDHLRNAIINGNTEVTDKSQWKLYDP